jgi:hypothetical protein
MLAKHLITTSVRQTVTASAAQLGAMEGKRTYAFSTTVACYVKQGVNPTATAGDGSALVPAGATIYVSGLDGAVLSVVRATADGECTLTQVVQS